MVQQQRNRPRRIKEGMPRQTEWPTLLALAGCYVGWAFSTTVLANASPAAAVIICAFLIAFHSSLQHEVIHGHPLPSRRFSEALVFPAVGLFIPYHRFRDLHLQHHYDPKLTDPYEDPETNYLDPKVWARLPAAAKLLLRFNNTLLGRMLVGPLIAQVVFMKADWQLFRSGDREIGLHWLYHLAAAAPVAVWVWLVSPLSAAAYISAAYCGLSLLKIRTYLEHRAHGSPGGRTAVILDRGLFSLLFLNNNYHFVHHTHPAVPWYRLPQLFEKDRERYLSKNDGYLYSSYGQIFARHFFRAKDPVPHPLWPAE